MRYGILLMIVSSLALSSENEYAIENIPIDLLPADAVVRKHSTVFEIKNIKRAILNVKYAATIFSKKEEDEGVLVLWYDHYHSIEELEGVVYNAQGEEIKTLEDSDIKDFSAYDGVTLHGDTRYKVASLYHNSFPYTIEYTYEIEFNGSLNWPEWYAQHSKNPVQNTSLKVICPEKYPLRYWSNKDTVVPLILTDGDEKIFEWSAVNLKKFDDEDFKNALFDLTTMIEIAPEEFQMDDYRGSMKSWKDFGEWCYKLYENRSTLPIAAIEETQKQVDLSASSKEKIKKLYEFMQSKTRYVSIQLGIGGWQPFDAEYVSTHGYGDCKALVNYMSALLKTIDIPSYPVLIKSGSMHQPMITEFPSNQFNHVILCVPLENDTIWLECTSQIMPFNMLSDNTENRNALALTPLGGIVVHTPATYAVDNRQDRISLVTLHVNGSVSASIATCFFGNQSLDAQASLIHKSPEDRQQWVLNKIEMPDISLKSLLIEGLDNHAPNLTLNISTVFNRYASVSGGRIFMYPNLLERRTYIPPQMEKRLSPIHYDYPYVDKDSVYFSIPTSHVIETLPQETKLETSFGSYYGKTFALGDTAIVHNRRIEIHQTKIPAAQYSEYRNFWSAIAKSERSQIVLKRR